MVQMSINLGDVGRRPVSSGRALSVWATKVRASTAEPERVLTTEPRFIGVVDGLASIDIEPGPIMIQFHVGGPGDSRARAAVVPDRDCTLREVLENTFTYEPEVVSDVRTFANAASSAAQRAEDAADAAESGTVPNSAVAAAVKTGETKAALDGSYAPVEIVDELDSKAPIVNKASVNLALAPYNLTAADTPTQVKAKIEAAVAAAAGLPVILPQGDWTASLSFTNEDVHLTGPGRLVQPQGQSAVYVARTPGAPKAVTFVGTTRLGALATFGTEVCSSLSMPQDSMADLKAGDVALLSSQDFYQDDLLLTGSNLKTYTTSWFPVLGFGLTVNGIVGGGFAEGDTVVGAGGATGRIQGVAIDGADRVLVLTSFTGTFVAGEDVSVGSTKRGVVSAVPSVLMSGRLRDTHATAPVLRKMPVAACTLNLAVKASGDVNDFVGTTARAAAIDLRGVVNPQIKANIESAWSRAVMLSSCLAGSVDVVVSGALPNKAQLSEQGYGYGVELYGATEATDVKVIGKNLRHAFTTNVHSAADFASAPLLRTGVPKDWRVHDSIAWAPTAAGFDTHHGSYDGVFDNCVVFGSRAGGRVASTSNGFVNRGWRTVFRNCDAYDVVDGFTEQIGSVRSHAPGSVRYIGCNAHRYQRFGFTQAGLTALDAGAVIDYAHCRAEGDGSAPSTPHYQAGFYASLGYKVRWNNCDAGRFNNAAFRVNGAASLLSRNCFADLEGCPTSAMLFAYDTNPAENSILGFTYRVDPAAPTACLGVVRVDAVSVTALNTDGMRSTSGTSLPMFYSTGAGSLTWGVPLIRGSELFGNATWDPPSVAAGAQVSTTVNVQYAQVGDLVQSVSFTAGLSGLFLTAQVTGNGTVTVWLTNPTASAADLGSGTVRVLARRRPY